MDLNRLKISEEPEKRRGSILGYLLFCLIGFALGFGVFKAADIFSRAGAVQVETAIVKRASGGDVAKSFSAGGWVEASTPKYPLVLSARISERLESVEVYEGMLVKPGQVLAKLYDKDMRSRLEVAGAQNTAAAKELEKMQAGFREEDIRAAESTVDEYREILRIAESIYGRRKDQSVSTFSAEEVDKELSTYRKAEAAHSKAVAELEKMRTGYRPEDIAIAQSRLDEAGGNLNLAERNLEYCTIMLPENCPPLRVLSFYHHTGDWISEKEERELIALYDPRDMQVRVDVTQSNIQHVKVGASALVRTEAHPEKDYTGTVLRLEPLAVLSKNTITVRVRIDEPDDLLFPEMVAHVSFLAEKKGGEEGPVGLLIPESALVESDGDSLVFVVVNGRAMRKEVECDGKQGKQIAIASGLTSGQRVILNPPEDLVDNQPVEEN